MTSAVLAPQLAVSTFLTTDTKPPGDLFTVELVGEPMMIVRGAVDQIRALSTVCLHRACPKRDIDHQEQARR